MTSSSILGGERAARPAAGRDVDALGPSDSSDSGSDVQGEREMPTGADSPDEYGALPVATGSDSDAMGTGERGSAVGADGLEGADIAPDHIETLADDADLIDDDTDIETLATDEDDDEDDDELEDGDDDSQDDVESTTGG